MVMVPDAMAMMPMVVVIIVIGKCGGSCGQRCHSDYEDHGDFFHRLVLDEIGVAVAAVIGSRWITHMQLRRLMCR